MRLTFVSHSIIDFSIDTVAQKAIGKILIYYRRDDAPAFLEHEQIHISCPFNDREAEWRIRSNLIKLAKNKLLRLQIAFPQVINNIFAENGDFPKRKTGQQSPTNQNLQSTHIFESRYRH